MTLKVDRFTRSLRHGASALATLADRGVTFVAVVESFDTSTPAGRMMLNLLMVFAEFERERIAERMAEGREGVIKRETDPETGLVKVWAAGGRPAYGKLTIEDLMRMEVSAEGDASAGEEGRLTPAETRTALLEVCEATIDGAGQGIALKCRTAL